MEDYQGSTRRELMVEVQGYVKEFTRHSNDVLLNLNELRHRNILTDATLLVGSARLHAHCAVLIACRSVCRHSQDTWAICFLSSSLPSFFPFPPSFLFLSCFQQNALLFEDDYVILYSPKTNYICAWLHHHFHLTFIRFLKGNLYRLKLCF